MPKTLVPSARILARLIIVGALALAPALGVGCAGENATRPACQTSTWAGSCRLQALTKVEDRELPMPYVVYEAIYLPLANTQYPGHTPTEVRLRFGTPAQYELALRDHLQAQSTVSCQSPVAQGSCVPEGLVANVVPFDPARAAVAPAPRTTGCAAIEAASEQDRVNQSRNEKVVMPERFLFDSDSSALSPDATATASAVARQLNGDPTLECVGLVGQITPGESPSLAEARAHAIKELLVSMGVARGRLLTIAVTANVFGPGARAEDGEPNKRRVSLSVLLKTPPAQP